MTSLAKQLQRLAVPHVQTVFAEDKRKKSLLFDPKEAAELDKETFYSLGTKIKTFMLLGWKYQCF